MVPTVIARPQTSALLIALLSRGRSWFALAVVLTLLLPGCGTTQNSLATQQLLESDAIDAAVAQIDFSPLSGHRVYFDATYLQDYKGVGFVNSNYVISGLRQQILAAGCLLQETRETAEYIVEGRLGTLGSDQHDVVYGLPKNNALNAVASIVPTAPTLPAVPELAVAKKVSSQGAAKLALFAYDRETRAPVWQSGLSLARSTSRNTWLLGAGPFQNGTIHRDDVEFAGNGYPLRPWKRRREISRDGGEFLAFERAAVFQSDAEQPQLLAAQPDAAPLEPESSSGVVPAAAKETVEGVVEGSESASEGAINVTPPLPGDEPGPLPFPEGK